MLFFAGPVCVKVDCFCLITSELSLVAAEFSWRASRQHSGVGGTCFRLRCYLSHPAAFVSCHIGLKTKLGRARLSRGITLPHFKRAGVAFLPCRAVQCLAVPPPPPLQTSILAARYCTCDLSIERPPFRKLNQHNEFSHSCVCKYRQQKTLAVPRHCRYVAIYIPNEVIGNIHSSLEILSPTSLRSDLDSVLLYDNCVRDIDLRSYITRS